MRYDIVGNLKIVRLLERTNTQILVARTAVAPIVVIGHITSWLALFMVILKERQTLAKWVLSRSQRGHRTRDRG